MGTELTKPDIIREILKSTKSPAELIPDDMETGQFRICAKIASNSYYDAGKAMERLRPFMARILQIYKKRPELYRELGYTGWDHWMTVGVKQEYGIARPDAYNLVHRAEVLSELSLPKLEALGVNKGNTLCRIVEQVNKGVTTVEMKKDNLEKWVAIAEETTDKGLKERAAAENAVYEGSLEPPVQITIWGTKEVSERWEKFTADELITGYVGSIDKGVLLDSMMAECESEWRVQAIGAQEISEIPDQVEVNV